MGLDLEWDGEEMLMGNTAAGPKAESEVCPRVRDFGQRGGDKSLLKGSFSHSFHPRKPAATLFLDFIGHLPSTY